MWTVDYGLVTNGKQKGEGLKMEHLGMKWASLVAVI